MERTNRVVWCLVEGDIMVDFHFPLTNAEFNSFAHRIEVLLELLLCLAECPVPLALPFGQGKSNKENFVSCFELLIILTVDYCFCMITISKSCNGDRCELTVVVRTFVFIRNCRRGQVRELCGDKVPNNVKPVCG